MTERIRGKLMIFEKLIDRPVVRKSAILRKGLAYALEPFARIERCLVDASSYDEAPPIFVNSLPKSGTHLLLQVTRALPGTRYLGRFIATRPTLTLKLRSPQVLVRKVAGVLPGETLGAHLYHLPEVAAALAANNALHLFIYRDPRDVITSEAYYLAEMNRWHRMHKYFNGLQEDRQRRELALNGIDDCYPEANARLLPYAGWLSSPGVIAIRYEDIAGPRQKDEIEIIVAAWRKHGGQTKSIDDLVGRLVAAINPNNSHTFHEGGFGKWRRGMLDAEAEAFSTQLAPALAAFGYQS